MNKKIWIILISSILYGISIPISKIISLNGALPTMMAAFTYLGAGIGLGTYKFLDSRNRNLLSKKKSSPLAKNDLPYLIAMVLFDIAAIILLMKGISKTNGANASLLSNCEIAATSLIALLFFKENISMKLWIAIILIIIAGIILTFERSGCFVFSWYSLLTVVAYICWGAENNCTKILSSKDTIDITIIKGSFAGLGSLIIALLIGENFPSILLICMIMLLGFFSYGLSVALYIKSQNYLGAAKTAFYFSSAPFFGVFFSLFILREIPDLKFFIALIIMIIAAIFISKDYHN